MKDENYKEIYIQFDLGDIDLPLRYNKCINLIEQARNNLKAQIVIINKKQDHKGKQLLNSNEVLKVKAFKCYVEGSVKYLRNKIFAENYKFTSEESAIEYMESQLMKLNENSRYINNINNLTRVQTSMYNQIMIGVVNK